MDGRNNGIRTRSTSIIGTNNGQHNQHNENGWNAGQRDHDILIVIDCNLCLRFGRFQLFEYGDHYAVN